MEVMMVSWMTMAKRLMRGREGTAAVELALIDLTITFASKPGVRAGVMPNQGRLSSALSVNASRHKNAQVRLRNINGPYTK